MTVIALLVSLCILAGCIAIASSNLNDSWHIAAWVIGFFILMAAMVFAGVLIGYSGTPETRAEEELRNVDWNKIPANSSSAS